jgi:hypothetical protein
MRLEKGERRTHEEESQPLNALETREWPICKYDILQIVPLAENAEAMVELWGWVRKEAQTGGDL